MTCVRFPFVLLLLLVCAQLAGPWGWNAAAGEEIIRQGVLVPYEITGPDGWEYSAQPHEYVLGVFQPEEHDALYPYISLTQVGGPFQRYLTPEELVQRNLYERPGAVLLSSEWIEQGDASILMAEFSWSSELGDIRAIKTFHPWERTVLVVTAVSLATEFEQYQPLFLESVRSVQVKAHPDETEKEGDVPDREVSDDAWLYED